MKYPLHVIWLKRRKSFLDNIHMNAFFAIKLAGLWMLFSSEYILKRGCKISLEKDYFKSEMNEIFGERLFLFHVCRGLRELVGAKPLHLLTQTAPPLKSPTGAFIATQPRPTPNAFSQAGSQRKTAFAV